MHLSSLSTKKSSLKTLRQFFGFLKRNDLILIDPAEGLPPIHSRDLFPRCMMTADETEHILRQPNTRSLTGFRDKAMMETLYSTGIRCNELAKLTVYDIDFPEGLLRVDQGKGGKDRVVPIGRLAVEYVQEYLEKVRPNFANDHSGKARFIGFTGFPVKRNNIGARIRKYVREAGLKKPISCHTFRHTCATEMLRGGSSVRYVQEMLGHAHIKTTQVYTRVAPIDLKKVHQKSHPRGRRGDGHIPPFDSVGGRPRYRK